MSKLSSILLIFIVISQSNGIADSTNNSKTTTIVNLKPISLIEEQKIANNNFIILFNFTNVLQIASGQNIRLELIPSDNRYFYINNNLNVLLLNTSNRIDREQLINENACINEEEYCLVDLKIAAISSTTKQLFKLFILPIRILDINDNSPQFKQSQYNLNISENLNYQETLNIPLEAPYDLDSSIANGIQSCHINSNNSLFRVDYVRLTKRLFLSVLDSLDRETKSIYNLTITCSDHGLYNTNATTNLLIHVLDANDNIPYFINSTHQLNVTIFENEPIHNLIQIQAFDNDDQTSPNGQLIYSLPIELNTDIVMKQFSIDSNNGIISLRDNNSLFLDYELQSKYTLKVKCQDKGATNSVPIYMDVNVNVLDVNDNAPKAHFNFVFKSNEGLVMHENKLNNTIWINEFVNDSIATTKTISYLTLSDQDQAETNNFTLNAKLIDVNALYRSNQTIFNLSNYFKLVKLVDDYSNMYYSLDLVMNNNSINFMDSELVEYFDLKFRLNDVDLFDYIQLRIILIDRNDHKPIFLTGQLNYYQFNVDENQLKFNFAKVTAQDLDTDISNSEISYRILTENNQKFIQKFYKNTLGVDHSDANYLFYIDSMNGTISLRGELDREQCHLYLFTVRAENNDEDMFTDVLVEISINDLNDNQPIFQLANNNTRFELDENMPVNTKVGNVYAHDADLNPRTEYRIIPNEMEQFFYINNSNGDLLTRIIFDAEKIQYKEFQFQVEARDPDYTLSSATFSKINVSIYLNDLNDNQPFIQNSSWIQNRLINFNLFNITANKSSQVIKLLDIKSIDFDRDSYSMKIDRWMHEYKFGFIRRMSWQFVLEIVKNHEYIHDNLALRQNLINFIENLIDIQLKTNVKLHKKVNMRDLFSIKQNNDTFVDQQRESSIQLNLNLNEKKNLNLNWGIYNISFNINNETSSKNNLVYNHYIKLFVYNLTNSSIYNETDQLVLFDYLSGLIDDWWSHNLPNLIQNYANNKRRKQQNKQAINQITDNNGDDLDQVVDIEQDELDSYYLNKSSSIYNRNSGSNNLLYLTNSLKKRVNSFFSGGDIQNGIGSLIRPSSSSVIVLLMSLFILIAIMLISLILYKHFKESSSITTTTNTTTSSSTLTSTSNSPNSKKVDGVILDKRSSKFLVDPSCLNDTTCDGSELIYNNNIVVSNRDEYDNSFNSNRHSLIRTPATAPITNTTFNQSTKDLTSSPNLAASKFNFLATISSSASSTSSNSNHANKNTSSFNPVQQQHKSVSSKVLYLNANTILNEQMKQYYSINPNEKNHEIELTNNQHNEIESNKPSNLSESIENELFKTKSITNPNNLKVDDECEDSLSISKLNTTNSNETNLTNITRSNYLQQHKGSITNITRLNNSTTSSSSNGSNLLSTFLPTTSSNSSTSSSTLMIINSKPNSKKVNTNKIDEQSNASGSSTNSASSFTSTSVLTSPLLLLTSSSLVTSASLSSSLSSSSSTASNKQNSESIQNKVDQTKNENSNIYHKITYTQPQQRSVQITNLYPFTNEYLQYQQDDEQKPTSIKSSAPSDQNVKIYLEKFERIYNNNSNAEDEVSNSNNIVNPISNGSLNLKNANSNNQYQMPKPAPKATMTTYSYV